LGSKAKRLADQGLGVGKVAGNGTHFRPHLNCRDPDVIGWLPTRVDGGRAWTAEEAVAELAERFGIDAAGLRQVLSGQ
jgi:hypothetical protein